MPRLFISYRQDDAYAMARGIENRLVARFGRDDVFRDEASIRTGDDWRDRLSRELTQCDIMVLVIGSGWLTSLEARLDQVEDIHRDELETALTLGKTIMPILVPPAEEPPEERLPAELRKLTALQYRTAKWYEDPEVDTLLDEIERWAPQVEDDPEERMPRLLIYVPTDSPDDGSADAGLPARSGVELNATPRVS